eukprot:TRINITY_DN6607_c0_g2_i2.p1 TRINITY_DN6607_c0_g2~~TRINITY_DN6607_c0_g2_i2.p1  ORF type:complete len:681 (+),score=157.11 TRINITY_DN6607_c0_g2_i2:826-2868(+)
MKTPPPGQSFGHLAHNELLAQYKLLSQTDFTAMANYEKNETFARLQGICYAFHVNYLRATAELGVTQEKLVRAEREILHDRPMMAHDEKLQHGGSSTADDSVVHRLESYLKKIEREIVENDCGEDPDKEVIRQTLASRVLPSSLKAVYVVENILKSFDDLIFIMKKRLNRYEKESAKLKEVVDRFGTVDALLQENENLKKENARLRFREERFSVDSLLQRPNLHECSAGYLRTMVICLQNELSFHKNLLEKYNIVKNPCLGLLVTSPAPGIQLSSTMGILDLISQRRFKLTFPELLDTDTMIFTPSSESQTLEGLSVECEQLRNKVARLEKLALQEQDVSTPGQAGQSRRKTLRQIQDEKAKETRENQLALLDKERTIEMLNRQLQEAKAEKDKLIENATELSYNIVVARKQNKELRRQVQELFTVLRTLHLSNVALATHGAHSSDQQVGHILRNVYGEILSIYIQYSAAAVKVQSWFRGCKTRKHTKKLRKENANEGPASSQGLTSGKSGNGGKSRKDYSDGKGHSNHIRSTSTDTSLMSKAGSLSEEIMGSALKSLHQLVLRGHELDTLFLCRLPQAIQQARLEMVAAARHHVLCMQRGWEEQMRRFSTELMQAVRIVDKPAVQYESQATQTPLPSIISATTQYDPNYFEENQDDTPSLNSTSSSFVNPKSVPQKKKR